MPMFKNNEVFKIELYGDLYENFDSQMAAKKSIFIPIIFHIFWKHTSL